MPVTFGRGGRDLPHRPVREGCALAKLLREVKAHAPHCRVILTVYEMKRLGRDAAELTALADHLTAHGLVLEMLAGPLAGTYDPSGPGRMLFAFFAAMAETERENTREATATKGRSLSGSSPRRVCAPRRRGPGLRRGRRRSHCQPV